MGVYIPSIVVPSGYLLTLTANQASTIAFGNGGTVAYLQGAQTFQPGNNADIKIALTGSGKLVVIPDAKSNSYFQCGTATIDLAGRLYLGTLGGAYDALDCGLAIASRTGATSTTTVLIRALAGQSGMLTDWQNSLSATMASVSPLGLGFFAGGVTILATDATTVVKITADPDGTLHGTPV